MKLAEYNERWYTPRWMQEQLPRDKWFKYRFDEMRIGFRRKHAVSWSIAGLPELREALDSNRLGIHDCTPTGFSRPQLVRRRKDGWLIFSSGKKGGCGGWGSLKLAPHHVPRLKEDLDRLWHEHRKEVYRARFDLLSRSGISKSAANIR